MITKVCVIAGILLATSSSYAQTERESSTGFYRLDFVTKELDDTKVVNTRSYSLIVSDKSQGGDSLRAGSRLPVASGHGDNFTYYDLGVSIDVRNVREVSGQLTMQVSADTSSVAADTAAGSTLPPVVRQYKWNASVIVPLRKGTQIFSSDDLGSKRKFQIELTATPIK